MARYRVALRSLAKVRDVVAWVHSRVSEVKSSIRLTSPTVPAPVCETRLQRVCWHFNHHFAEQVLFDPPVQAVVEPETG